MEKCCAWAEGSACHKEQGAGRTGYPTTQLLRLPRGRQPRPLRRRPVDAADTASPENGKGGCSPVSQSEMENSHPRDEACRHLQAASSHKALPGGLRRCACQGREQGLRSSRDERIIIAKLFIYYFLLCSLFIIYLFITFFCLLIQVTENLFSADSHPPFLFLARRRAASMPATSHGPGSKPTSASPGCEYRRASHRHMPPCCACRLLDAGGSAAQKRHIYRRSEERMQQHCPSTACRLLSMEGAQNCGKLTSLSPPPLNIQLSLIMAHQDENTQAPSRPRRARSARRPLPCWLRG